MAKKVLGKGLSALLNTDSNILNDHNSISNISLDLVNPNPHQPRQFFNEKKLEQLAQSIQENGIIQPIVVARKNNRYEIIVGERRWRACQLLKYKEIPCIIKETTEDKNLELALIENIQREDLNPIEEAQTYKHLIEKLNITQEKLSQRLGKSRSYITNSLRLLKLEIKTQQEIISGNLSEGHGRTLLSLKDDLSFITASLIQVILDNEISVRQLENFIKSLHNTFTKDPNLFYNEEDLKNLLQNLYDEFIKNNLQNKKSLEKKKPELDNLDHKAINPAIEHLTDDSHQHIFLREKIALEKKLKQLLNKKVKIKFQKKLNQGNLEIQHLNLDELKKITEIFLKNLDPQS